ncbi:MAG TPA: hypothetical protein VIY68_11635 [Steroidobacteraceae bacterium]
MRPSGVLFAASMMGLGVAGLVNGDFALVWQQIPLDHLPGRTFIAYVCALIELATGMGLLLASTRVLSCRVLFVYLLLWLVLLKLPGLLKAPLVQESWADFGEIAIIVAGGWCLFASRSGDWEKQHLNFLVGARGIRAARFLLILSLPMIGLDVLVHSYTLPAWLRWVPLEKEWIYLSGVGSLATCLGLALGIFPRLAATMEAAMLGVITLIYWARELPTGRTASTAFIISAAIASGVWIVADTYRNVPWLARGAASRKVSVD